LVTPRVKSLQGKLNAVPSIIPLNLSLLHFLDISY